MNTLILLSSLFLVAADPAPPNEFVRMSPDGWIYSVAPAPEHWRSFDAQSIRVRSVHGAHPNDGDYYVRELLDWPEYDRWILVVTPAPRILASPLVTIHVRPESIFNDGFETGDTSAWASSVPDRIFADGFESGDVSRWGAP